MTSTFTCYYNQNHSKLTQKSSVKMSTQSLNQQLDVFLREQQKQAYAIALIHVKQETDALDVIQEAMLAFVNAYRNKPQHTWRPLFYRILQNKINDHHRRQTSWLRIFFSHKDKDDLAAEQASDAPSPLAIIEIQNKGNHILNIIKKLPDKQKQVIIYRHWQQMSETETAQVMQISKGSVKTHLFRATQKIKSLTGASDV